MERILPGGSFKKPAVLVSYFNWIFCWFVPLGPILIFAFKAVDSSVISDDEFVSAFWSLFPKDFMGDSDIKLSFAWCLIIFGALVFCSIQTILVSNLNYGVRNNSYGEVRFWLEGQLVFLLMTTLPLPLLIKVKHSVLHILIPTAFISIFIAILNILQIWIVYKFMQQIKPKVEEESKYLEREREHEEFWRGFNDRINLKAAFMNMINIKQKTNINILQAVV